MRLNDVVTVVTVAGEFVGKFVNDDNGVVLKDPRLIVYTDEGMGFGRGLCNTGKESPERVHFHSGGICFVTDTNDEIARAYHTATSNIILQ